MVELAPSPAVLRIRPFELEIDGGRLVHAGLALVLLAAVLPLLLILAFLVWAQDGASPIFGHERVGRHGAKFRCLKFRTMVPDASERLARLLEADPAARAEWERDHKLRDDPRITPLGRFLRKSSLDELPQLVNVVLGDMDLVGPRPIVFAEISKYRSAFRDYCRVRPGITGLWQVSGRNDVSYSRRVAMDVLYARRKSIALDVRILAATLPAVLLTRGSY